MDLTITTAHLNIPKRIKRDALFSCFKILEIGEQLCKSIPDYAKTPLKESLQTIKTISPELEEKANGYIKYLDEHNSKDQ